MLKHSDFVKGKGYFTGYLCKHCGKPEGVHKKDTKACPDDLRKSFPVFADTVYSPDEKKPIFSKFLL